MGSSRIRSKISDVSSVEPSLTTMISVSIGISLTASTTCRIVCASLKAGMITDKVGGRSAVSPFTGGPGFRNYNNPFAIPPSTLVTFYFREKSTSIYCRNKYIIVLKLCQHQIRRLRFEHHLARFAIGKFAERCLCFDKRKVVGNHPSNG